jgi:ATP-binding cassette subfamily B protein
MSTTTYKKENITLRQVLRAFWRGMKHHKALFYVSVLAYFIGSILDLLTPLMYKRFFDTLTSTTNRAASAPQLVNIILIILGINLLSWVFYRGGQFVINAFEAKVMNRLRQGAFTYILGHSYTFFTNSFAGALVQRVGRFVRSFERLFDTVVFNFMPLGVSIIGVIIILSRQQPKIALVISIWAAVVLTVNYTFTRWKLKYDIRSAAADSRTTAYLSDTIANQNAVSLFAATEFESSSFSAVSTEQSLASRRTWDLSTMMNATQALLIALIEFILFYYAVNLWRNGIFSIGSFVLIQVYIIGLSAKLWSFSSIIRNIYEGVADSKEMVEILELPYEVQDKSGAKSLIVAGGKIEFKNISFSFNDSRQIINGLSFDIKAGEKAALIGPSGAGKSTVIKLLLRMYDLKSGQIEVDGQDIREVTQESLRKNISLVPQDPVLFHRTLMENIRYGRLDATDAEVREAARLAHCDEFIEMLPSKYDTFVGERGIKLSGGERQRVAIARAILKNAPILILDEATSSLDSHSEALIQDALDKLMRGKTSIVIAHRLSTIKKMDRIIVIDKGQITEEGTHGDLVSREESLYKNLWSLQAGGFILNQ